MPPDESRNQRIRSHRLRASIRAVEWRVGPADGFQKGIAEIRIVVRQERNGEMLYAITQRGRTANKDGEWEVEPLPSSRDDEYVARCRWADWDAVALMADRLVARDLADRIGVW